MSLAVVQAICHTNSANAPSVPQVTFGAGPTSGNLMLALVWMSKSPQSVGPAANTGWTLASNDGPGSGFASYWGLYYRYAGASESTTQVMETDTREYWSATVWEVSGVSGVWANDFQGWHDNPTNNLGSTTLTTSSFNTANNNELVLLCAAGYSSTSGITISSGNGVSDASFTSSGGTDGFGTYDDVHGYHFVEATSGTAIQSTLTQTANNNTAIAYAYVELNTAAVAPTETGTVAMALRGVSFNGALAVVAESGAAALALKGIFFNASLDISQEYATAALALSGVTITASGLELGAPGTGAVHFATFGA